MGAWLNPGWDNKLAMQRIEYLKLDPNQKAGKLSGGQHAQLVLTVALAKRPELLILDELRRRSGSAGPEGISPGSHGGGLRAWRERITLFSSCG